MNSLVIKLRKAGLGAHLELGFVISHSVEVMQRMLDVC